jgi:formate--tetrahydrofolate ligase
MDELQPISAIARDLGIEPKFVQPHGQHIAKISLEAIRDGGPQGKLVVVTGVTPTPAGEGKTTISVGLSQALAKRGKRSAVTLREPSLAPIFGIKGGGAGGGRSRVVPEDEINLHFTGDSHAVASAHNLLAALVDNAARRRAVPGLHPEGITWRRVTDVEDRALRLITTGLGGRPNGPVRETGFDIVAASEIMAVLALAESMDDLRYRLGRITVAYTDDGTPITADHVDAVGSLMALLRHALLPNLVQTVEGSPALVHTGPFGNIAHGSSSVIADRLALGYADYVVTESGFGADLGFEKFMHIKARSGGLRPSAAVLVATVRALKSHGGSPANAWAIPDPIAVQIGAANLQATIGIVRSFGLPVVVAINRFPTDTPEELVIMQDVAIGAGASAAVTCSSFADGGDGTLELAEAVIRVTSDDPPEPGYLYTSDTSIRQKVHVLATKVYGAANVRWSPQADRRLTALEQLGLDALPVCMAKTHLSLSHDPALKGRPSNYTFEISDVHASTGAGFVYPIAGPVLTMPGLPSEPRRLDVDDHGQITGL